MILGNVSQVSKDFSRTLFRLCCGCLCLAGLQHTRGAEEPELLKTRWADAVSAENVLPEYPRPQLRRDNWQNLNGEWDYAIVPEDDQMPEQYDGKILVPFPIESLLSGVRKHVDADQRLWYRREFKAPPHENGERVLLNFGAVDWQTTVWINGARIDSHYGGYDSFSFDITDALQPGQNEIVVSVWDPTDAGIQPRGKQIRRPHGIWYTAVTGIWQTVWLEVAPANYIETLRLVPNVDQSSIEIVAHTAGTTEQAVHYSIREGSQTVATAKGNSGKPITLQVPDAKLWSPDNPYLYDLVVETAGGDRVESYFGLRKVEIGKDDEGINRILLNGEPLFQYGLLDQGWWPDGLYTAPTDEALRYDLEVTKQLGFNMVRKHVKIEPARWYYWCDKLGLLVWQDMPSGDKYIGGEEPDITRTKESGANFERELKAMVETNFNHPSIVMWVPYNEGWGQWDTERITALLKKWDPTRLVNSASGWIDRGTGDVHDIHSYPGPDMPPLEEHRAVVLGEFGGLGLAIPGHLWQEEKNWGYRSYPNQEELFDAYRKLITRLHFLVEQGLAAAVYTQTTDVEIEVNGILTYDREVVKLPPEAAETNRKLYQPAPKLKTIIATSEEEPQIWRYTFSTPSADWYHPEFDDSSWKEAPAGFGGNSPPRVEPRTPWLGNQIWLRRQVDYSCEEVENPLLRIYHDEDAEIYINGKKIAALSGYTTAYEYIPIDKHLWEQLEPGPMTIAVHCQQTLGGQFIDVGIIDMIPQSESEEDSTDQVVQNQLE